MKLRASRHIFEIGISSASPIAPWICMQRSATRKPSSVPAILVMKLSCRASVPASARVAV
jgi:hypothetical protein